MSLCFIAENSFQLMTSSGCKTTEDEDFALHCYAVLLKLHQMTSFELKSPPDDIPQSFLLESEGYFKVDKAEKSLIAFIHIYFLK